MLANAEARGTAQQLPVQMESRRNGGGEAGRGGCSLEALTFLAEAKLLEAISLEFLIAVLASVPLAGWIVQMQELLACLSLPSLLFLAKVLFCKDAQSIPGPEAAVGGEGGGGRAGTEMGAFLNWAETPATAPSRHLRLLRVAPHLFPGLLREACTRPGALVPPLPWMPVFLFRVSSRGLMRM